MPRLRQSSDSHPSGWSLCFDSKLVVVVVVIGLMETMLKCVGWEVEGFSFRLKGWQLLKRSVMLKPGFHYTANATTTTQKQSDYKVEQSSFTLIALFWLKIGRCRGRNWLNGNQALMVYFPIRRSLFKIIDAFSSWSKYPQLQHGWLRP